VEGNIVKSFPIDLEKYFGATKLLSSHQHGISTSMDLSHLLILSEFGWIMMNVMVC
jgi:hypothetical protein